LFKRVEDARVGAIAAGVHHAPGTIGFGRAWARINCDQWARRQQDGEHAHYRHGKSP
jgi:hypothetical protein